MRVILLIAAILEIAHCTCPQGFELVRDGECRGLAATIPFTFNGAGTKAFEVCDQLQAQPVIIRNDEHQKYWASLAPDPETHAYLFLAIVCNTTTRKKEFRWADGSKIDHKPILVGWDPDLDEPCEKDLNWYIYPNGAWAHGEADVPDGGPAQFYCTKQLEHQDVENDGCTEQGVCYEVGATVANRQDAESICAAFGADLASIHNQNDNDYVRRMAVSRGAVSGVFVGASASTDGAPFSWSDGSAMDYQNFYPGFPKKNFGDCLAMDTSTADGKWMNIDCTSKLPVACMKKRSTQGVPVCTGQDYKEGEVITSPGFPYLASTPCDYFLTVAAGKKVELEIILLEANSCCDSLILYDGYVGASVLAKVSGNMVNTNYTTTASNVMRVSWQPNGGLSVRGVAMKYRAV